MSFPGASGPVEQGVGDVVYLLPKFLFHAT
jgi:hypothetical protein